MPYIPENHKQYDVLPYCRENGGEVFNYPSELLHKLEERTGIPLIPYGYYSYDEYYEELDQYRAGFLDEPEIQQLFDDYKQELQRMNTKENWSICKYKGERIGDITGLVPGHTYYWPTTAGNPVYDGVIDEEEFTSYLFPTEAEDWDILEDPTGMAYRTLYETDRLLTRKNYDQIIEQLKQMAADTNKSQ